MQIDVVVDDLAFVTADAVARPVNAELRAVTPVMRRLELAAGEALFRQLHVQVPLEVGAAVVTGGGAIPAPLMIHAVIATPTEGASRDGIRRATASALQRAHDFGIDALAIAPFGLGAGNLDVDDAARTMVAALRAHAERAHASPAGAPAGRRFAPSAVTIVVESELEADAFRAALAMGGAPSPLASPPRVPQEAW